MTSPFPGVQTCCVVRSSSACRRIFAIVIGRVSFWSERTFSFSPRVHFRAIYVHTTLDISMWNRVELFAVPKFKPFSLSADFQRSSSISVTNMPFPCHRFTFQSNQKQTSASLKNNKLIVFNFKII